MKRYLAFAGMLYYPKKGMEGLVGDFDSIDEAKRGIEEFRETSDDIYDKSWEFGWAHVFDTQATEIVWKRHPDDTD